MKKIALILSIWLATSSLVNAAVDNQYMTTSKYLVNTGYSAEMARLGNITNQDPYREPEAETGDSKNIARRIYWYIVPGENTDFDFYQHSGYFNGFSYKDY